MELITFFLLWVASISAASTHIKTTGNLEPNFYYEEAFLHVADKYIAANSPSKKHDTVFSFLRQGLSVPTFAASPVRTETSKFFPSIKIESRPFPCAKPNTNINPIKSRSFSRSFSSSSSDLGSDSNDSTLSPISTYISHSSASVYSSPETNSWVTAQGYPIQTFSHDKSFRVHYGGIMNIGKLISFIPDISDFQRVVNEKYLPVFLCSYVFITSGTLNPNFVSRVATGSTAIKSTFSSRNIEFKLKILSASIGDLVVFDTIRAIVLESDNRGESTITIIFNDRIDNFKHLVKNILKSFLDFSKNYPSNYFIWGSQSN